MGEVARLKLVVSSVEPLFGRCTSRCRRACLNSGFGQPSKRGRQVFNATYQGWRRLSILFPKVVE